MLSCCKMKVLSIKSFNMSICQDLSPSSNFLISSYRLSVNDAIVLPSGKSVGFWFTEPYNVFLQFLLCSSSFSRETSASYLLPTVLLTFSTRYFNCTSSPCIQFLKQT